MQGEQYLILSNDDQYRDDYQCIVGKQVSDSAYSYNSATKTKAIPVTHHTNPNQQLQDLLQSDTVSYSQFSTQKKRLFPYDISFFSRDHTQDLTNQQGYNQMVGKIHFERSRNRQLVDELAKQKERIIEKYLGQIMEEFKELSEENQRLRREYKRQAGGGYNRQQGKQLVRNNSGKQQQELRKSTEQGSQSQLSSNQTPRNSTNRVTTNRKSIATLNTIINQPQQPQFSYSNIRSVAIPSYGPSNSSSRVFYGVGGGNFYQPQKLDTLRNNQQNNISNRLINCDSSTSIIHHKNGNKLAKGQNNVIFAITQRSEHQHAPMLSESESKQHNRRESQFTQRKNYPTVINNNKENYNEEFLMMCDDEGEVSFYNNGRMSQPGKMMKKEKVSEVVGGGGGWNQQGKKKPSADGNQSSVRRVLNQSTERASFKLSLNQQAYDNHKNPTSTKNIFIEFLETILLQEHLSSQALTENIQQTTVQQERDIFIPTFHNIRYIEQLQKQITNKNIKLRQLQEVINVFKLEIEQIMGTDVKIVNQLMVDLLQVKGKYLEMQQKVNNIAQLKVQIQGKEMAKQKILAKMKQQNEKQSYENKSQTLHDQNDNKPPTAFPIPQSIQTLFQLLSIPIAKNSKPIQYLNKIKQVPKNKDLFQAFDSKKRSSCNIKIKQVIDQIKQGRRKFNQVIKIYESRIIKLQEKIQRYKLQMSCSINNNQEKKYGNVEK